MKRWLTVAIFGLFLLPALACGSTTTTTNNSATTTPATNRSTATVGAAGGNAGTPAKAATGAAAKPTPTTAAKIAVETGNVANYRDSLGNLYFIGEVVNTGTADAANIQIAVSLLDAGGQTVATGQASALGLPALKPGQKTVWRALINNAPETWQEQRVQAQASQANALLTAAYYLDLQPAGVTLTPPANEYGWVKASGQVTNTGQGAATFVVVTIGLYGANGKLLAVADGATKLQQLTAGGSAPFAIDFVRVKEIPPKFEVYVHGVKQP
ncbi:MAG TPA: FxLYD domain-containing protein [Thermomicrobiales bacterium]|nr:FxLYD domain-containing protein [Thermomicrobiales bacterium]